MNKVFAIVFVAIFALSCMNMVSYASTQTIPKPSVPQFTVKLVDTSYDVSPTTTVNPYNGEITTKEGTHVEARAIEVRINNEPFTPFEIQAGTSKWTVGYYYQIRWKGHFEDNWHEMFLISDGLLSRDSGSETVFAPEGTYSETEGLNMQRQGMYAIFPPNSQLEFQVKAMIGYIHREVSPIPGGGWLLSGEESDWSNIETLKIAEITTSLNPNPTVPEFSITAVLCLLLALPLIATVLARNKRKMA